MRARVRAERLVEARPVARARHVRRRDERPRGDAGARGARRLLAARTIVSPSGWCARQGDARVRDLASLARAARRHAGEQPRVRARCATRAREAVPYEGVEEPFVDLAQGRTTPCCSTTSSSRATAAPPEADAWSATSPTATTRSRVRAGRTTSSRQAIDRALGASERRGGWRRILARWQFDGVAPGGARGRDEAAIGAAPRARAPLLARASRAVSEGRGGDAARLAAAMALAAPLGLALALVRLESRRCVRSRRRTSRSTAARPCSCSSTSSITASRPCSRSAP